jgi:hypothetical protein
LDNENIEIIPANEYTPEHRQFIKALKWLKYASERYQINILHSRNGGEKQIGPYKVDGYEFHGCFWHGCQKCFSRLTQIMLRFQQWKTYIKELWTQNSI